MAFRSNSNRCIFLCYIDWLCPGPLFLTATAIKLLHSSIMKLLMTVTVPYNGTACFDKPDRTQGSGKCSEC